MNSDGIPRYGRTCTKWRKAPGSHAMHRHVDALRHQQVLSARIHTTNWNYSSKRQLTVWDPDSFNCRGCQPHSIIEATLAPFAGTGSASTRPYTEEGWHVDFALEGRQWGQYGHHWPSLSTKPLHLPPTTASVLLSPRSHHLARYRSTWMRSWKAQQLANQLWRMFLPSDCHHSRLQWVALVALVALAQQASSEASVESVV